MRGINYIYTWYKNTTYTAISRTGASAVRTALSDDKQYAKDGIRQASSILNLCEGNNLVAVLGVFDKTESNDGGT
jgi:uncharacterized membrane protein YoaK (UPF0700 family)